MFELRGWFEDSSAGNSSSSSLSYSKSHLDIYVSNWLLKFYISLDIYF